MAFLYLTEHPPFRIYQGRPVRAPEMPPLATQRLVNTGGSTQSAPFNSKTRVLGVHADSPCSIEIGTNPTATTSSRRLAPNKTEYVSVTPGQRLAVILNS